ncbi:MAG: hypothetical protein R3B90_13130 [Planctomycetaceae bacterium]
MPDASGEFVEAIPFTGFPGGKTKTIAIELNELFDGDDTRVRLATSMELYWDRIAFVVDEESQSVDVTPLALRQADYRWRGFSARVPHPQLGPETYDYQQVSTAPAWPSMAGSFTRYGDVRELLSTADDRQVVMGSGDTIELSFAAPDRELPEGWRRDFLLHCVGWDKDADLQTIYGQTSEPLPFRGMTQYPYEPGESFPDDEPHREYLREWQTREQPARQWLRWSPPVSPRHDPRFFNV